MNNATPTTVLKLAKGNAKLPKSTMIFGLPAGKTCPGAQDCKSQVQLVPETGRYTVVDGPESKFRCYAATAELIYKAVREAREHNYQALLPLVQRKDINGMVELILRSMHAKGMKGVTAVRVHDSGDYETFSYFVAWMQVATAFPDVKFYSYTKSLPHVVRGKKEGIIPPNFYFTASKGGKFDYLIEPNGFKSVTVTTTAAETDAAVAKGGKFDHDDSLALGDADFFLQVHGVQPKGTPAAKYWDALIKGGKGGYNKVKRDAREKGKVIQMKRPKRLKKAA